MNIKQPLKIKLSLSWVLVLAFLVIVTAEAWMGYKYLHASFFSAAPELPEDSVVRVNLKSYQSTVSRLEELFLYEPGTLNLPRSNPFR